jgi:GalNAc-alpha-(1->4)-GalNAc-alpha-(1->3)-diNAcBac-PP-undecaprenol alpha-1,4-N-acetyl-D-galactosaminyltransferase
MLRKIACLIPSLQPGGMERVMSELLSYFATLDGVEVHLVMFGMNRDIFYDVPSNIIIHTPDFLFDNSKRMRDTLKTMGYIRSEIKKIDPDTVLSYGELWNNLVLLSLLKTKYPVFVSDRCQPTKSIGKMHDFLRKILYPHAKGIIAQTSQAKDLYLKKFGNKNIVVIGNPITLQEPVAGQRENIVLTVGRLIASKHHDELIKLFAALDQDSWKLIIVGGDALTQQNMARLEKLIESLGVNSRVELAGNQKDVESYYRRSKIFAFTSSSEGFPNVVGEALSFGLPVVTFDCVAGPSDMVENGVNGYLVDLFDYKVFSEKLEGLMQDQVLRNKMAEHAPLTIKKFEKDVIARQYFDFITKL